VAKPTLFSKKGSGAFKKAPDPFCLPSSLVGASLMEYSAPCFAPGASSDPGRVTDDPVKVATAIPFLMTITPGVLFMRLRRPRPRWRRLVQQPGMAACSAAIVPIAIALLQICRLEWQFDHVGYGDMYAPRVSWESLFWDCGFQAGLWVLAAWLALALSGRRLSEPSAIDRLGRLVGAGWLMILAVQILGTA
jgi:hypothetical protein